MRLTNVAMVRAKLLNHAREPSTSAEAILSRPLVSGWPATRVTKQITENWSGQR